MNKFLNKYKANDYVLLFSAGAAVGTLFLWAASYIFPEGEIAFPNADDSSRIVRNKEDLEDWKKITRNSYGNVKIVFNPKAIWYDQVKVKDENFIKDKEMSIQAKAAFLDRERKAGRTTGLD